MVQPSIQGVAQGGREMNDYWKCVAVCMFVGGIVLAGFYLGMCALFVISGNY